MVVSFVHFRWREHPKNIGIMKMRLLTILLALVGLTANVSTYAEDIPIDEAHFPDEVFRDFIRFKMTYRKSNGSMSLAGADGKLSEYERKHVEDINLYEGCTTAEGIKYFSQNECEQGQRITVFSTKLETLDLSGMEVTEVDALGFKMKSLNVSDCTKLTKLNCSNNELTTLNIAGCSALRELFCSGNLFEDLNISSVSVNITYIDCSDNPKLEWLFLPNINYAGSSVKTYLDCSNTAIHTLDLRDNIYRYINCSNSSVTGIEWSPAGNGYVQDFDCSFTPLRAIDIESFPNQEQIKALNCNSCGWASLDVSGMTALESLRCDKNQLTALDLSHNANLMTCSIYLNQLLTIDLTNNPQCTTLVNGLQQVSNMALAKLADEKTYIKLDRADVASSISGLYVWYGNATEPTYIRTPTMKGEYLLLDESGSTDISRVSYNYTASSSGAFINVEITIGDNHGIAIDPTNFPDPNFRNYLLAQPYGADALLTQEEIDGITSLDIGEKGIISLLGIQHLTALTFLDCSYNNLDNDDVDWIDYLRNLKNLRINNNQGITGFNANRFPNLQTLYCQECNLTTLSVNGNTKLRYLQCSDNQLTAIEGLASLTGLQSLACIGNQISALDVSNSPFLTQLECGNNSLTALDVTHNPSLKYLRVYKNQISALDLTQNQQLKQFQIYGNQLKTSAMAAIANALPTLSDTYNMRAYNPDLETEGNELSPAIVNALRAKGWNPQYYNGTSWQDYAGATITYGLKLNGTSVTSANCGNLTAINGVTGSSVRYDELTNTLTLAYAEITGNSVGLENSIEGLTIEVEGSNTINITDFNAVYLKANTTITGSSTSKLTAVSNKNGIYIYAGTLTVKDGVTVSGGSTATTAGFNVGYGIYGRTTSKLGIDGEVISYHGALALEGSNTVVKGLGIKASIGNLDSLTRPSGTTIKVTDSSGLSPRQVTGYFRDHNVCTKSGTDYPIATGQVTITTPRDGIGITTTNFPDEILRNYLSGSSFDKDRDGWLTNDELEDITTLSLNNQGVTSLTGVTYLFALDRVYVNGNSLTTANFAGLNELRNIDIMENSLTEDGIASMISSLPQGDGSTTTILIYHEGSANENNFRPTMALTEAANAKGWRLMYQTADNHYKEFLPAIEINEANFPDANFRNYLLAQTYGTDGWLTNDDIQAVTQMELFQKEIEDLTGIEYFTELVWLGCSFNELTELDLSQNTKLEVLFCNNNQLTSLTIGNDNSLRIIYCHNNQLNEMDMNYLAMSLPDRSEQTEPGGLYVISKDSSEGNSISKEQVAYLKDSKNWTCYYTTNYANWFEIKPFVEGDVNGDESVTIADVTALVNIILGKNEAPASGVADVNDDGGTTIADVTALVNIILGKN